MNEKEIKIEYNTMHQDDFSGRISELLSRRSLQKSQIYKHITHSQTIPLFRSNYILSCFDFCYVPAMGQYTRGEKKETQVNGWKEKQRHKS